MYSDAPIFRLAGKKIGITSRDIPTSIAMDAYPLVDKRCCDRAHSMREDAGVANNSSSPL